MPPMINGSVTDRNPAIDVDAHTWQWPALPILEPEKQAKAEEHNYALAANTLTDINAKQNRVL